MSNSRNNGGFVVTGTDTGVGKTVVSAMLVGALNATYYKPIQAGLDSETDIEVVRRLSGLTDDYFIPERYRLQTPASPHLSAEIDKVNIDIEQLSQLPTTSNPLIVEGAGGIFVPLTRSVLLVDVFKVWQLPAIICSRTTLGTINHTLLSVEALRQRSIPIHGIVFVGDHHEENETIIPKFANVPHLGRLPFIKDLNENSLQQAFHQNFQLERFIGEQP